MKLNLFILKRKTGATAGNLSVQIEKLAEAGYIDILKLVSSKRSKTICRITNKGHQAFAYYFDALRSYEHPQIDEEKFDIQ